MSRWVSHTRHLMMKRCIRYRSIKVRATFVMTRGAKIRIESRSHRSQNPSRPFALEGRLHRRELIVGLIGEQDVHAHANITKTEKQPRIAQTGMLSRPLKYPPVTRQNCLPHVV